MIKKVNFINISNSEKKDISNIYTNSEKKVLRSNKIFTFIKENAPCTPYDISKRLKLNYTLVHRTVKDLEYVGLIQVRVILTEDNRAVKQIILPEKLEEKGDENG